MKQSLSLLFSLGFYALGQGLSSNPAAAQVTPDGTTATTVDVNGNNFAINNGTQTGTNLFHSFNQFSVPTGGSAVFNNAADINNIFSRVTGGNISTIDGLLQANGTANLFLINPAGIIFGENSSLSIGGSFYGSTADSILFPEGEFSAVNPNNQPVLTINAPIGLRFRDDPAGITATGNNQSPLTLTVRSGSSFDLIGGELNLNNGSISIIEGNIELVSLSQAGTVELNANQASIIPETINRSNSKSR